MRREDWIRALAGTAQRDRTVGSCEDCIRALAGTTDASQRIPGTRVRVDAARGIVEVIA